MNKTKSHLGYIVMTLVMFALLVLAGCSKTTNTITTNTSTTNTSTQTQYSINSTSKAGVGTYLVDGKGVTLYWTNRDSVGQSNITGATLANWPVFYVSNVSVPSSLNASDFGTITKADGSKQTTFKGWPLYYYIKDQAAGDTLGQGLAGVWFAVNPALSAPPAPTTATTSTTVTTALTSPTTTTTTTTGGG